MVQWICPKDCFNIQACRVLNELFGFECQGKGFHYNLFLQGWDSYAFTFHSRMCGVLSNAKDVVYIDDILIRGDIF